MIPLTPQINGDNLGLLKKAQGTLTEHALKNCDLFNMANALMNHIL